MCTDSYSAMDLTLDSVRNFLLIKCGILPERISLQADFHKDLGMTFDEIDLLLNFVSDETSIFFSRQVKENMSDFFDLLMYIKIKEIEISYESISYSDLEISFASLEDALVKFN